jgi:hypothetical protein
MKSVELYVSKIFIEGYPKSRQANYRYILLESERVMECTEEKSPIQCFGIEIVREDIEDGEISNVEMDCIEVMTTYRYKVVQLLRKLYDNCVSPVNLIEIAGPIADEWVSDFDEMLSGAAVQ